MHLHQFAVALSDTSNLTIAVGAICLVCGLVGLRRARRVPMKRFRLPNGQPTIG